MADIATHQSTNGADRHAPRRDAPIPTLASPLDASPMTPLLCSVEKTHPANGIA